MRNENSNVEPSPGGSTFSFFAMGASVHVPSMKGRELLVWWGDALLDAQHGERVVSNWCEHDHVAIVLRPTQLEQAPSRPAALVALLPAALVAVGSLGAGAWLQRMDARALHARATSETTDAAVAELRQAPLPSWVPPELCVPPPSPSDQDDRPAPIEHDPRAEQVAYSPRGDRGASEGASPMRQSARAPQTLAQVLDSVDWQRPVSAFRDALDSRAGDEWWTAGGDPGTERIRIVGMGYGGGGRGLGPISLGTTIGVADYGRRGCTHMCCFQRCRRRPRGRSVRLGTTTVIGALERDTVRRIERRHLHELRSCYDDALETDDALEGALTVQYFISPHGNVRSAIIAHSDLDHEGLEECFLASVRRWMFEEPINRAMVSVSQPFRLALR